MYLSLFEGYGHHKVLNKSDKIDIFQRTTLESESLNIFSEVLTSFKNFCDEQFYV